MNTLEQAVEKIEQGWCRGNLIQDGKVCALGAMALVELNVDTRILDIKQWDDAERDDKDMWERHYEADGSVYEQLDRTASARALAQEIIDSGYFFNSTWRDTEWAEYQVENAPTEIIFVYNDDTANSREDVIEMFKSAAKRLDPKV